MERRYKNLDVIRTIACLGIVLVHVLKNITISRLPDGQIFNFIFNSILLKLEKFVSLFFILSGFSISCGYYNKIKNSEISMIVFYKRRLKKIYPLFALLVIVESFYLLLTQSGNFGNTLMECIADLSLSFAFLPFSNLTIVGVGWALGVIFAFYMIYPFLVFATCDKKNCWIILLFSIILSYGSRNYFSYHGVYPNANIAIWMEYFILGIIIYLYRGNISAWLKKVQPLGILILIIGFIASFQISFDCVFIENLKNLLAWGGVLFSLLGEDCKISNRKIIQVCSKYSFEIYLLHMPVLRILEKTPIVLIDGLLGILINWLFIFGTSLAVAYVFDSVIIKVHITNRSR